MTFLLLAWSAAQRGFSAVLVFCSRPPGSWIAAILVGILALWWFGQHEVNRGKSICESAHAEATANEVARQAVVVGVVNKASNIRTSEAKQIDTGNKKVIVYVHDKAAALPTASNICVDADSADAIRGLR